MLPPTFFSRPSHKSVVPRSVRRHLLRHRFIFCVFRGSVMCAVVALTGFQCALAWILKACTFFQLVFCLFHFKSPLPNFQKRCSTSSSTQVPPGAANKSQPCSSDLCLHFLVHIFCRHRLSKPCRVSASSRQDRCFRRVQQAGLYNLLVSLVHSSFMNARVFCESTFLHS